METILELHTDMLLGLPGMLFLGVMGILFVIALISGTVLYAPFMRRQPFGVLRTGRGVGAGKAVNKRVGRIDQHNLIGIVTLAWALVIGLTGVINAFADPLTENWRDGEVARMTAIYAGEKPLDPADYGSPELEQSGRNLVECRHASPIASSRMRPMPSISTGRMPTSPASAATRRSGSPARSITLRSPASRTRCA